MTGLLEGQFLQGFLSSATRAWSAKLRPFGGGIVRFGLEIWLESESSILVCIESLRVQGVSQGAHLRPSDAAFPPQSTRGFPLFSVLVVACHLAARHIAYTEIESVPSFRLFAHSYSSPILLLESCPGSYLF